MLVAVNVAEYDNVVPPSAPSALSAVAVNGSAIELRWKEPTTSNYDDDDDDDDDDDSGPTVTGYTVVYAEISKASQGNQTRLSLRDPATAFVTRYSCTHTHCVQKKTASQDFLPIDLILALKVNEFDSYCP